jgi:hypothetical protein
VNRVEREQLSRTLRAWALAYAGHGWSVFPVAAGGKSPAGGNGYLDATCDADVVTRMWDRFPLAHIGVAAVQSSGISVLDVNPKSGGDESLARLLERHGPLPAGPTVSTPSGGTHHYFRHRPGLKCSVGSIAPGVDVRSTNGYACVPPSVRPDGRYVWVTDPRTPLADGPEWLLPAPRKPFRGQVRQLRPEAPVDADRALAGLVRTVAEAPQGTRNGKLFWAACRLAEHAAAGRVPLDVGAAVLLAAAAEAGLPAAEADRTLRSALSRAVAS